MKKLLRCPLCGRVRTTWTQLAFHVALMHAGIGSGCPCGYGVCSLRGPALNNLARHLRRQPDWREHLVLNDALAAMAKIGD